MATINTQYSKVTADNAGTDIYHFETNTDMVVVKIKDGGTLSKELTYLNNTLGGPTVVVSGVTVDPAAWAASEDAVYKFKADVTVAESKATLYPELVLNDASTPIARKYGVAPTVASGDGKITLMSRAQPTEAMTGDLMLMSLSVTG